MPSNKLNSKPKPSDLSSASLRFEAIGTLWEISISSVVREAVLIKLQRTILRRIEEFDRHYIPCFRAGFAGQYYSQGSRQVSFTG